MVMITSNERDRMAGRLRERKINALLCEVPVVECPKGFAVPDVCVKNLAGLYKFFAKCTFFYGINFSRGKIENNTGCFLNLPHFF